MEVTSLTVKLIVLLLPGIFGTFFYEKLSYKKQFDLREYIVSVIIIGFLSYSLLELLYKLCNSICNCTNYKVLFFDLLFNESGKVKLSELFDSTIISLFVGIVFALFYNKGIFYGFFRKMGITNESGKDVWNQLFDNDTRGINAYVYVINKKEDIIYGGEVAEYSPNSNRPELLLENVVVTRATKRDDLLYKLNKVYLRLTDDIVIEIDNKGEK